MPQAAVLAGYVRDTPAKSDSYLDHSMRAAGATYIAKHQKASLTEPGNIQDARQMLVTASVRKTFPPTDDFAGGQFNGTVEGVDGRVTQEDGSVVKGIFYRVK